MSLSKEDVQRVSLLARLKLSDNELTTMTEQLGQIVSYIDKLSELNTEGVEPMAHALDLTNAAVVVTLHHLGIGEPFMRRNASAEVSAIEQDREAIKRHILSSKMFLGKLRGPIFGPESSPKHSQRRPGELRGTPRRSRSRPNSSEPGPSASEACGAEVFPPPR